GRALVVVCDRGVGEGDAGGTGGEAVVLVRATRRGPPGVAPAVAAAADVRAIRCLAIGDADHLLGYGRERADGLVAVVQPRLRVDAEAEVDRVRVPRVRADHGEALRERARRGAAAKLAQRGRDRAVQAAVPLVEKAAIPGERQPHLE